MQAESSLSLSRSRDILFGFDQGFNSERFSDKILVLCLLQDSPRLAGTSGKRQKILAVDDSTETQQPLTIDLCNEPCCPSRKTENEGEGNDCIEVQEAETLLSTSRNDIEVLAPMIMPNEEKKNRKRKRENVSEREDTRDILDQQSNAASSACVELERLYINSLLLSSRSEFFQALFSNGMSESNQKEIKVFVTQDEKGMLVQLIQFLYTGRLEIAPDRLTEAIRVANKFAITLAVLECVEMLQQMEMSIEKAEEFLDFAKIPDCEALVARAKGYLLKRFEDFEREWHKEAFLSLGPEAAAAVLESDQLIVNSENTIFQALRSWLLKSEDRIEYLPQLFSLVRLPLLDSNFLKDALFHSPLFNERSIPGFTNRVITALELRILPTERQSYMQKSGLIKLHTPRVKPKEPAKNFVWLVKRTVALGTGGTSNLLYVDGYYFIVGIKFHTKENRKNMVVFCCLEPTRTGLYGHFWVKPQVSIKLKSYSGGNASLFFSSSNHALSMKQTMFRWAIPREIMESMYAGPCGFSSPEDEFRFEVSIAIPEVQGPATSLQQTFRQVY